MRCIFGHWADDPYLVFLDGIAEAIACNSCARDIEKMSRGMSFVIGRMGSQEVIDYLYSEDD